MPEEEVLRPIRELLDHVRKRTDHAIGRLRSFEEARSLRWRCTNCGHTKPSPVRFPPKSRHPAGSAKVWLTTRF